MKGILIFFFLVFAGLAGGVYFYETQIAKPGAADALSKTVKKAKVAEAVVLNPGVTQAKRVTESTNVSRVIDLTAVDQYGPREAKRRRGRQKAVHEAITKTIKKSISVDIQKAVVTEIAKLQ